MNMLCSHSVVDSIHKQKSLSLEFTSLEKPNNKMNPKKTYIDPPGSWTERRLPGKIWDHGVGVGMGTGLVKGRGGERSEKVKFGKVWGWGGEDGRSFNIGGGKKISTLRGPF